MYDSAPRESFDIEAAVAEFVKTHFASGACVCSPAVNDRGGRPRRSRAADGLVAYLTALAVWWIGRGIKPVELN